MHGVTARWQAQIDPEHAHLAGITAAADAWSGVGSCGQTLAPGAGHSARLKWDAYGMAEAQLAATRSKDPSTQCGAAIFDAQRRLVSKGYNGFPRGVPDDPALLAVREAKLGLTIHAEANAILFAQQPLAGCTIYVWPVPPCSNCATLIAQVGITRVVTQAPGPAWIDRWGESMKLAHWVYTHAGIDYLELEAADGAT